MKINYLNKFFYLLLSVSIFIELYFNIDAAGSGGFISDFNKTWPLVEDPFKFNTNIDFKFPLHYYIAAIIYKIFNDKEIFRFVYCLISLVIPYLFFLILKIKYKNIKIDNLFLFSLIIFLLPSFRSAAIWPNTQITGIFFFLLSLLFFIKWENYKRFNIFDKNLFLSILFLSLAVYSRQVYAMIFFYYLAVFYIKCNKKIFIQSVVLIGIFALPGIIFLLYWPRILQVTFEFKLYNSLLVNSSILAFYLIPFFSIIFFYEKKIKLINDKKIELLFIILFVFICSIFFDYDYSLGGGFFIKFSKVFFGNLLFFFLTSILGLVFIYHLSKEHKLNMLINLILLFSFSAYMIFMKYFEPMFIIILFLLMKTNLTVIFLKNKKNIYLYHLYFLIYFSSAVLNSFLLLSKNI